MGLEIPFSFSFASYKPPEFQSFYDSKTRPHKKIRNVVTGILPYLEGDDKHKVDFMFGNLIFTLLSMELKNFTTLEFLNEVLSASFFKYIKNCCS